MTESPEENHPENLQVLHEALTRLTEISTTFVITALGKHQTTMKWVIENIVAVAIILLALATIFLSLSCVFFCYVYVVFGVNAELKRERINREMEMEEKWKSIAKGNRFVAKFFRGNEGTSSMLTSSYAPQANLANLGEREIEMENLGETQSRPKRPMVPKIVIEDLDGPVTSSESLVIPANNMETLAVTKTGKKTKTMQKRPEIPRIIIEDVDEPVISRESSVESENNMNNLVVPGTSKTKLESIM